MIFLNNRLKRGFKPTTNFLTRAVMVIFAAALVAQPFGNVMPVFASSLTTVTASDLKGWTKSDMRGAGIAEITSQKADKNGGNGSLNLALSGSSDKAGFIKTENYGPVSSLSSLGFDWYRDSSSTAAAHFTPAVGVYVSDSTGSNTWLLKWEGVYNGYPVAGSGAPTNTWTTENLLSAKYWRIPQVVNGVWVGYSGCNQAGDPYKCWDYTRTLQDDWLKNFDVVGVDISAGSGWSGTYNSYVDNVKINNTTYDFEVGPTLAAENFNTTSLATDGYAGISVGFNAKDFTGVSDVTVTMTRAAGGDVVMHGTADLYNLINQNNTPHQFTAPFVIQPGSYNPSTDSFWTSAPAVWDSTTIPTSVTITVTGSNGTKTVTNSNFKQGAPSWPTYLSTLPNAEVNAENFNTVLDINNPTWGWNGVSVGFNYHNFQSVQSVNVKLYSAGKLIAKNVANSSFITNANNHEAGFYPQATSPFFVQVGSYGTEAYWDLGNFTPKPTEKPDQAVITVVGTDLKGNLVTRTATTSDKLSGPSYSSLFDDITPPHTTLVVPTGIVGKTFTVSGDATDNFALNRVYVQLVNRQTSKRYGGTTVNLIGQGKSAHWSVNYDAKVLGLPDGTYAANVSAVDMSGNTFNPGWSANFTVDTTKPTATLVSPLVNSFNPSSLTVEAQDAKGLNKVTANIYNEANSTLLKSCSQRAYGASSFTLNCAVPSLGDGVYTIRANASDTAGNVSVTTIRQFSVDKTAPVVKVTAPNDGDLLRGTVTVSGTVTDANPDHYYLVVKDSKGKIVAGPGVRYQSTVSNWNWDTIKVSDGVYTIVLEARDKAGNKDVNSSTAIQVTVDNTAPVVTDTFAANLKTGDKLSLAPSVTGDTDVTYNWTVSDPKLTTDPKDALNGQTLSIGPAPAGSYKVDLVVTDKAGNKTSKLYTVTISTPDNSSQNVDTSNTGRQNSVLGARTLAGDQTNGEQPEVLGASTVATTTPVEESSDNAADNSSDSQTTPANYDWVWWAAPVGAIALGGAAWWLLARRRGGE